MTRSTAALVFALGGGAAAACGPAAASRATTPARAAPSAPSAARALPPGPMRPVTPTEYGERLAALGLDPANLPKLGDLPWAQRRLVMDYLAEATGADCLDCHAGEDRMGAPTARKSIASHMWDDWARGYTLEDKPIFCDSCHHGSLAILDRRDEGALRAWMKANLAGKLSDKSGKPATCATCHGEPFRGPFLEAWRKED